MMTRLRSWLGFSTPDARWPPQLDTAEMKLEEAQSRLARFRDRKPAPSRSEPKLPTPPIQRDPKPSPPPIQRDLKPSPQPPLPEKKAPSPAPQPSARPQLVIPGTSNRPAPRPEPMPGLKKAAAPSSSAPLERSRKEEKKPKRKIGTYYRSPPLGVVLAVV